MPTLHDPNFAKTLILICDYSPEHGAMGIILNQPTTLTIYELLNLQASELEHDSLASIRVHSGGPVDTDHGFILHDSHTLHKSTIEITDNLFLTSSTDILEDIAQGQGPDNKLIVLGYAGWTAGQLEDEISTNSWLTINYHPDLVFSTPVEQQWLVAGQKLGVDLNLMSSQPGHA